MFACNVYAAKIIIFLQMCFFFFVLSNKKAVNVYALRLCYRWILVIVAFPPLKMFLKELQYTSLCLLSTTMRHVPQFGFKLIVSMLAFPCVMHRFEGFLHA